MNKSEASNAAGTSPAPSSPVHDPFAQFMSPPEDMGSDTDDMEVECPYSEYEGVGKMFDECQNISDQIKEPSPSIPALEPVVLDRVVVNPSAFKPPSGKVKLPPPPLPHL